MSNAVRHRRHAADDADCKCCGEPSRLFGVIDFAKRCEDRRQEPPPLTGIPVYHHRCTSCGFVFTTHLAPSPKSPNTSSSCDPATPGTGGELNAFDFAFGSLGIAVPLAAESTYDFRELGDCPGSAVLNLCPDRG